MFYGNSRDQERLQLSLTEPMKRLYTFEETTRTMYVKGREEDDRWTKVTEQTSADVIEDENLKVVEKCITKTLLVFYRGPTETEDVSYVDQGSSTSKEKLDGCVPLIRRRVFVVVERSKGWSFRQTVGEDGREVYESVLS